jgi:hypothetical protein
LTTPHLWGIEKDMAKRQTRRSISVSRSTYERLRAYCETNGISMSQFVEHRVGDFLGRSIRQPAVPRTAIPQDERREVQVAPVPVIVNQSDNQPAVTPAPAPAPAPVVMSAATPAAPTRTTITPRPAPAAPPPAKLKPEQIFTF